MQSVCRNCVLEAQAKPSGADDLDMDDDHDYTAIQEIAQGPGGNLPG